MPPDEPPNPWGSPPTPLRPTVRPGGRPNGRPGGGGPGRPPGPWGGGGGGGGGPSLPDLEELFQRAGAWFRGRGPRGPGRGGRRPGGRGILLAAAAAAVVWLASGFYRVEPDEQGVVLRFGAFTRTTLPGLNYHLPYPIETVLTPAVTRVNRVEIGYRSNSDSAGGVTSVRSNDAGAGRDVLEEALMLTGDENIIDINFAVFWRIRDPVAFLFSIRNPQRTVKAVVESVMREVIGRTPIQPALTQARAQIEASVLSGSQAVLDQYGAGIDLLQVQLQKVDPPAEVIESFRDQQRANADADRARNEAESYRNDIVPRARGDAAKVTAEADGARQASIVEATGQAQRFLSVYNAYTLAKDVTLQRLYIETMQDILRRAPTTVVDDGLKGIVPYLPIDPGAATRSTAAAPAAAGAPAR